MKLFLDQSTDSLNRADQHGRTPLLATVQYGSESVVKLIYQTDKADLSLADNNGLKPLHAAVRSGNEGTLRLLLQTGKLEMGLAEFESLRPLIATTQFGEEALQRLLLGARGNRQTNKKDEVGVALLYAASWLHKTSHPPPQSRRIRVLLDC